MNQSSRQLISPVVVRAESASSGLRGGFLAMPREVESGNAIASDMWRLSLPGHPRGLGRKTLCVVGTPPVLVGTRPAAAS
jgi:hypothetical protein